MLLNLLLLGRTSISKFEPSEKSIKDELPEPDRMLVVGVRASEYDSLSLELPGLKLAGLISSGVLDLVGRVRVLNVL